MIDIRVEIKCNRCHQNIAVVTDVGAGLRAVRECIRDARRRAEKAAGCVIYNKRSQSHHCTVCIREIMAERRRK